MSEKELVISIKPLIDMGFFIDADNVLADCLQDATTEKSRDRDRVREERESPKGFDLFWNSYNKKVGKPNSLKQWAKIKFTDGLLEKIVEKAKADATAKPDNKFRKDPERWLKGQHWLDEVVIAQAPENKELPLGTNEQIEAAYRAECGDPANSRFQSYFEMRNFIVAQREKRKSA
jgi:hypothetical protein